MKASDTDKVTEWPFVKWVESKQRWHVDARTKLGGERKFFRLKGDALEWREEKLASRVAEGNAAFDATRLHAHGYTIAQALTETTQRLDKLAASVTVEQAVKDYKADKIKHGATKIYQREIKGRLAKVLETFGKRRMADITKEELENFLLGLGSTLAKGTVRAVRLHTRMLWIWAGNSERKYCEADRAKTTAGKAKVDSFKIEIFTAEELARLLAVAEPSIIPAIVLGAFCGLRQSEVARQTWDAINVKEGNHEKDNRLRVAKSKTGTPRAIVIPANAVEWLRRYSKTEGLVCPPNFRNRLDRARVLAGFKPSFNGRADSKLQAALTAATDNGVELKEWRDNGFRHSAITYRLTLIEDAGKVATWAGNSKEMVADHYNNIFATFTEAEKYFSIVPPVEASNVVRMVA